MDRTKIATLFADKEELGGTDVTVAGWVHSIRDMKNFGFVMLNDGSCFKDLQVVLNRDELSCYDTIVAQNMGAALIVRGTLVLTPERPQPFELQAKEIEVEGPSAPDYPLQKKRTTVEFLGGLRHPRVLPGPRLRVREHAHHHGLRRRGRGRDVPRDHHRSGEPPSHGQG